ncbi:hypothetical protein [Dechloromonas sp.]|uniref:hypothetical protein n=1 Tax=Dechloromonas sp. TaxID=1917218 RepID=UPI002172C896|nr:hypothetical protein [Dechloromonas sp.]MBU3697148.1 hypothetical protein [Dechloromonas sp.]
MSLMSCCIEFVCPAISGGQLPPLPPVVTASKPLIARAMPEPQKNWHQIQKSPAEAAIQAIKMPIAILCNNTKPFIYFSNCSSHEPELNTTKQ